MSILDKWLLCNYSYYYQKKNDYKIQRKKGFFLDD